VEKNHLINNQSQKEQFQAMFKRKMTFVLLYIMHYVNRSKANNLIKKGFFSPKSRELKPDEIDFLKKGEPFSIEVDNQKIQAWRYGSGRTVLCVHGWASRGARFYSIHQAALKAGFSLVIFDGPGHGESEGKTSSYFQMTDTVRAMVNHIGVENIAGLIGHSFGSAAIVNTVDKEKLKMPLILVAPALNMKEILDEASIKHGVPLNIFYKIIAEYEQKYGYSIERDNPCRLILKDNNPTLLFHDVGDRTVDFNQSKEIINKRNNNIELVPTSNLGHSRVLSDPDLVRVMIDFISKNMKSV